MLRAIGGMILALAFAAGTAAAAPEIQPVAALKVMAEADVRALLSDVEIGPPCCDNAEEFYQDGSYIYLGFASLEGTYAITDNVLCIDRGGWAPSRKCRYIYEDAQDAAYIADEGEPYAHLLSPRPIHPTRIARHAEKMKKE